MKDSIKQIIIPQLPTKLIGPDDSQLCGHLAPMLVTILTWGNEIDEKVIKQWGSCDLEVNLKNPFSLEKVREAFEFPEFIDLWELRDSHYVGRERGVTCTVCKHTISCPLEVDMESRPYLELAE